MSNIQNALVGLVGLEHVYIFLLETFMWGTKKFNVTFGIRQQDAESLKQHKHDTLVKTLFQNQGFYNLILAAGLFWGIFHPARDFARQLQIFFTGSVVAAAIVGGLTTGKPRILLVQGAPAALALVSIFFGW